MKYFVEKVKKKVVFIAIAMSLSLVFSGSPVVRFAYRVSYT